jgi:hypothetical protein
MGKPPALPPKLWDPAIHSVVGMRTGTITKHGGSTGAGGLTGDGNSSSGHISLTTSEVEHR